MKYKFLFIVIAFILITFIATGCGARDNEYSQFTKSFNESFLKVANSIDCKNNKDSLERIKLEENKIEIGKMSTLLENIKGNVPKRMEADYKYLKELYLELLFLEEASLKMDNLTDEEKGHVFSSIVIIESEKEHTCIKTKQI